MMFDRQGKEVTGPFVARKGGVGGTPRAKEGFDHAAQ